MGMKETVSPMTPSVRSTVGVAPPLIRPGGWRQAARGHVARDEPDLRGESARCDAYCPGVRRGVLEIPQARLKRRRTIRRVSGAKCPLEAGRHKLIGGPENQLIDIALMLRAQADERRATPLTP